MPISDLLPFRQSRAVVEAKPAPVAAADQGVLPKLLKVIGLAIGFRPMYMMDRTQFQWAPYDFDRIIQAVDTDSYVKSAFHKYRELMWKEGWEIIGENPEAVAYVYQRFDFMELSMRMSFNQFLIEVVDELMKFGNAFVGRCRGDLGPWFPGPLDAGPDKEPIIGYELLPTQTMQIFRDQHNRPVAYRQVTYDTWPGFNQELYPTWEAEEMIHLYLDKKPGRVFGTPFMVNVMDDVIALRQIEEDIQNLVHRELFPLYKYKVGTDEHPAEPEEIEQAARELEGMRTEGGLVLPDRHDVEVIGSQGSALVVTDYLAHFKERVCVGLGMSPHHLGMTMNGGNRSVTDRLDIALYDKTKTYQRYVAGVIELNIINELLLEGGFNPITTPIAQGVSDRCVFRFHEIDVDTQVKRETHEIQKFVNNITTLPETRLELGLQPEAHEEDLFIGLQTRLQPTPVAPTASGAMPKPLKPDAKAPSTGGTPNRPNTTKGPGNIIRPANQFGRRTSPNIRHGDLNGKLDELVELIDGEKVE